MIIMLILYIPKMDNTEVVKKKEVAKKNQKFKQ